MYPQRTNLNQQQKYPQRDWDDDDDDDVPPPPPPPSQPPQSTSRPIPIKAPLPPTPEPPNKGSFFSDDMDIDDEPQYDTFKRAPKMSTVGSMSRPSNIGSMTSGNILGQQRPSHVQYNQQHNSSQHHGTPSSSYPELSAPSGSSHQHRPSSIYEIFAPPESESDNPPLNPPAPPQQPPPPIPPLPSSDDATPSGTTTTTASTPTTYLQPFHKALALAAKKEYGTVGILSPFSPDGPDHIRAYKTIRARSMQLYNAIYKINKIFSYPCTPNAQFFTKLVSSAHLVNDKTRQSRSLPFREKYINTPQNNNTIEQHVPIVEPQPIDTGFKQYSTIIDSCLSPIYDDADATSPNHNNNNNNNTQTSQTTHDILSLFHNIYELQRIQATEYDTATSIEAAYVTHHHALDSAWAEEEEARKKLLLSARDYLSVKNDKSPKIDKIIQPFYAAAHAYEEARLQSCQQICLTDLAATETILRPLNIRLQSYYTFFKNGYELMRPYKPLLQRLQKLCQEEEEKRQATYTALKSTVNDNLILKEQYLRKLQDDSCPMPQYTSLFGSPSTTTTAATTSATSSSLPISSQSGPTVTGIRDLDGRKIDKSLGTDKCGYLYTTPPQASRVWVELSDKMVRVFEEVTLSATTVTPSTTTLSPSIPNTTSISSANNNTTANTSLSHTSNSNNNSSLSLSSSTMTSSSVVAHSHPGLRIVFETSTQILTAKVIRDSKYRFTFQLVTPSGSFTLQAESDYIMNEWLDVIQNNIGDNIAAAATSSFVPSPHTNDLATLPSSSLLATTSSSSSSATTTTNTSASSSNGNIYQQSGLSLGLARHHQGNRNLLSNNNKTTSPPTTNTTTADTYDGSIVLQQLYTIPGNKHCADCGTPNPDWISINLGILVCLDCSGSHRQLGVTISKIRSVTMDKIEYFNINYALTIGNTFANSIYLESAYNNTIQHRPISPSCSPVVKTDYIKSKYADKKWVRQDLLLSPITRLTLSTTQKNNIEEQLITLLYNGIREENVHTSYSALVWGVDCTQGAQGETSTALHEAALTGPPSTLAMVLHFTIDVNIVEGRGWNMLHYAAYANSVPLAEVALAFGGSGLSVVQDREGKTPYDVAVFFNSNIDEYRHELPLLLQTLEAARQKYERRIAKSNL